MVMERSIIYAKLFRKKLWINMKWECWYE